MDFFDALRVIRRRWLATLLGLLLTAAGGVAAVMVVPTNHQASGQLVLLLPPDATPANGKTNPFLNLDSGLSFVGSLIISSVTTKQTERDMAAAGFTSDYSVSMTPGAGPILTVTVEDSDAARALATRSEVIRRLEMELERLQPSSRVPRNQLITALPNAVSTVAEPLPGDKLRALAVIGVIGFTLTLTVAFARDRRIRRRAQRQLVESTVPLGGEEETASGGLAEPMRREEGDPDTPDNAGGHVDIEASVSLDGAAPGSLASPSRASVPGDDLPPAESSPPNAASPRNGRNHQRRGRPGRASAISEPGDDLITGDHIEELTGAQRFDG